MKQGDARSAEGLKKPTRYGVEIVIQSPRTVAVNLAGVVKPLMDGVLSAFHLHDGSNMAENVSVSPGLIDGRIASAQDSLSYPFPIFRAPFSCWKKSRASSMISSGNLQREAGLGSQLRHSLANGVWDGIPCPVKAAGVDGSNG